MDYIMEYNDPADITNHNSTEQSEENALSTVNLFRTKSLLLATFPWFTVLPMVLSKLVENIGETRDAFHLANSLDTYDSFLHSQNIHNSPLKAILRDVNADPMSNMSLAAISNRETSMLRSREKANEFCSVLCAYRLLDIIFSLEITKDASSFPPVHKQMGISIPKNERALRPLENWTLIMQKFQHNFMNSKSKSTVDMASSDLPTRQLHALFQLHSDITVSKTLVNMQLAATHIAFMLDRQTKAHTIPDFPGTLQEFKDSVLRTPSSLNNDGIDSFMAFLEGLAGEKDKIDNLRLPLQVALLISPIFLLQDAQIHLSSFYAQRYKIALYAKALGNDRPKIVSEIETIIWEEIINTAKGLQTVHDAASKIVERSPIFYDHLNDDTCGWFMLAPITKKEDFLHLSSFFIKKGTCSKDWPCYSILKKNDSSLCLPLLIENGSGEQEENSELSIPVTRNKKRRITAAPSTSMSKPKKKSIGRRKSNPNASRDFSTPNHKIHITTTQNLPLVIGNIYMKVENFDLEELSTLKPSSTTYVPISENNFNLSKLSTRFHTFNVHGQSLEHTFTTPFEEINAVINKFLQKIEGNFTFGDHMICAEYDQISAIKAFGYETIQQMSPQTFQGELRSKHIIITNYNLPPVSCDRRGLTTLNSLKEVVDVEDQSTSAMTHKKDGILKQFVENLELNNPNTLCIIRMKSYSGAEAFPFASDHVAWRETAFNPYCIYDSSDESSLRWTNVFTANAVQFWRIAPAGFGIFLDIRSGCQLVIIATTKCTNDEGGNDLFTQWGRYFQNFNSLDPELFSEKKFEAIRLEPGNRLILRPNTPYAVISLEHTVVTGGFFLSSCTLYETLMGRIHSFVRPTLLTEGKNPPFSIYIRRIVHYMHNAYVMNDSSDRSHLLPLSSLDDARDLFALATMAIFLNVFDERTYQLSSDTHQTDPTALQQCHDIFDLNAIPVVERYHLCYTRGLSLDLLEWFFENYSFSNIELEEEDVDAYAAIFIPFIVCIGRQIAKYKRTAEEYECTALPTFQRVNRQIQSALFPLEFARDVWIEEKTAEEEKNHLYRDEDNGESDDGETYDLDFDLSSYSISQRDMQAEKIFSGNILENGKTNADKRFFRGLTSQFKVEDLEYSESEDSQYFSS